MNIILHLVFIFIVGLGATSWPANQARAQVFPTNPFVFTFHSRPAVALTLSRGLSNQH